MGCEVDQDDALQEVHQVPDQIWKHCFDPHFWVLLVKRCRSVRYGDHENVTSFLRFGFVVGVGVI